MIESLGDISKNDNISKAFFNFEFSLLELHVNRCLVLLNKDLNKDE